VSRCRFLASAASSTPVTDRGPLIHSQARE
jgi:hypothetical protein